MIYELRLYKAVRGRTAHILARFEHALPPLFARHGIHMSGCWNAAAGPGGPVFVYVLAWRDLAEREAAWAAFYADPEWWRVRAETNAGEEMVERFDLFFLKPNAAWQPEAALASERLGGVHELVIQQVALGQPQATTAFLADVYLPLARRSGAAVMAVCDMVTGRDLPQVVMMFAWKDAAARHAGWQAMEADAGLRSALKAQRQDIGRNLFGQADVYLLEPQAFSLPEASLGAGRI